MDEKKLIAMEHILLGLLEESCKQGINLVKVRGRVENSLKRIEAPSEIVELAKKIVNDVPQ